MRTTPLRGWLLNAARTAAIGFVVPISVFASGASILGPHVATSHGRGWVLLMSAIAFEPVALQLRDGSRTALWGIANSQGLLVFSAMAILAS